MHDIAIFGGMFDPPHKGHLEIATQALKVVSKVYFVPCFNPNHKDRTLASGYEHRYNMVKTMINNKTGLYVSNIENRPGVSYMIDTLQMFPSQVGYCNSVSLLIGLDSLSNIRYWHDYIAILKNYRLIVYGRLGCSFKCLDELQLLVNHPIDIVILPGNYSNISSTMIRHDYQNKNDKQVVKKIDNSVYQYIKTNNLYLGE